MSARPAATTLIAVLRRWRAGCVGNLETALERLVQARELSADLLVQFTRAADAGNRAVMADTDEASTAFAREAEDAMQAVQKDIAALGPILGDLRYSAEARLLEEFGRQFAEYRTLNQEILGLAVENSEPQGAAALVWLRPSSRPTRSEMHSTRSARSASWSEPVACRGAGRHGHCSRARDPGAAGAAHRRGRRCGDDAHGETDGDAEAGARLALQTLAGLTAPGLRPQFAAASVALDRFMGVNGEIVALSRRNSEVRSLALSLGQKRMLTAQCEETLRALQDALAKRSFSGTR